MAMSFIEAIGYLGVGLVFITFSMKTMIPLRVVSITSNVILIGYGIAGPVYPILALHALLLPLNAYRLFEMLRLIRTVQEAAAGDLSMDWMKPFTTKRTINAGEILFRKSDDANELFFVTSGRLRLRESKIDIPPGTVVGELGLLAPNHKRTQTLECMEDAILLRIGYDKIKELYFQNPKFGFYFLQLTSARLFENIASLERNLAERARS
jgi:hypothetical protein